MATAPTPPALLAGDALAEQDGQARGLGGEQRPGSSLPHSHPTAYLRALSRPLPPEPHPILPTVGHNAVSRTSGGGFCAASAWLNSGWGASLAALGAPHSPLAEGKAQGFRNTLSLNCRPTPRQQHSVRAHSTLHSTLQSTHSAANVHVHRESRGTGGPTKVTRLNGDPDTTVTNAETREGDGEDVWQQTAPAACLLCRSWS